MSTHKYQLNYCEWRQPDGSLLRGFCLQWQSDSQVGPSFSYFDHNGEMVNLFHMGPRVFDHIVMKFDRRETWLDVKTGLARIAGLATKISGRECEGEGHKVEYVKLERITS